METLKQWLRANRKTLEWLGDQIGRSRNSIKKWRRVPSGLVLAVEQATGIPRTQLRSDLYGDLPTGTR